MFHLKPCQPIPAIQGDTRPIIIQSMNSGRLAFPSSLHAPAALPVEPLGGSSLGSGVAVSEDVATLVGRVYEAAPPTVRRRLLMDLMQPLSLLSLVAVAGGVFASLRFRNVPEPLNLRLEDTLRVSPSDVMALTDYVQQVSVETVDALGQWLASSPLIAGSAATLLLIQVLRRRASLRGAWVDRTEED